MPRWLVVTVVASLAACSGEVSEIEGEPEGFVDVGEPGVGRFLVDGEAVELRYRTVDGHRIFEGDILLDGERELPSEAAPEGASVEALYGVSSSSRLWPHGVVPYVIDDSVTTPSRVRQAIAVWEATGIRFVRRTTQRAYVTFSEEPGNGICRAQVGYDGHARYVHLRDTRHYSSCNLGVVVHETGHVLGLWHEHTRPDRDTHVRVLWSHVPSANRDAFEIMTSGARRIGSYDIHSTMHYRSYTLTSDGGASIVARDGSLLLHDWATISRGDVAAIRALYFDGTPVPRPDAGTAAHDAGHDAGPRDAGSRDAGPRDAGAPSLGDGALLGDGGWVYAPPPVDYAGLTEDDALAGPDVDEDRMLRSSGCAIAHQRSADPSRALAVVVLVLALVARQRRRGPGSRRAASKSAVSSTSRPGRAT